MWNVTLGAWATLDRCMNDDCRKPIRKRVPSGTQTFDAQCFECRAEYSITLEPNGGILWKPKMTDVPCSTQGCPEKMALWPHEVKPGTHWRCRGCSVHNGITLSVSKIEDSDSPAVSEAVGPSRQ